MAYTKEELQKHNSLVAYIVNGYMHHWIPDDSADKCDNCSLHTDCMSELDSGIVYDLCLKMQGTDEGRFKLDGKLHPYLMHELCLFADGTK